MEDLVAFAGRSGLRSGGLPVRDGFGLAGTGGFVSGTDYVELTPLGLAVLRLGVEDEPTKEALRVFASALMLRQPPLWVAYWQGDPTSLDFVIPEPERQILAAAGLAPNDPEEDLAGWAWWDALRRVPLSEETAALRKAIGDAAEELTLAHERQRLEGQGFPDLVERVRWVARESPAYGFDVLSFCGVSFGQMAPDRPLAIEVKGTTVATRAEFRFFLTDYEWETAERLRERYIFHLWDGVRLEPKPGSYRAEPFVLSGQTLVGHLPLAPICRESCRWKSAIVAVKTDT